MPNIERLVKTLSQQIYCPNSQNTVYFYNVDLSFAYSQFNLHHETVKKCNFNKKSSDMTCTIQIISVSK